MVEPLGGRGSRRYEVLRVAFEDHYAALVRYCGLLAGRADVAEDLAMDTFVRSAERLDGVNPDATGLYLRRAATNLWRNWIRRLSLERRARVSAPDETSVRHEDIDTLWEAVQRLPDRQRACIVLRYYEDLSERDTAAVLGCAVGTVKSHTSRALSRLRKEIGDVD